MEDFNFLHNLFERESSVKDCSHKRELPTLYIVEGDSLLGETIQKYLSQTFGLKTHCFGGPHDCLQALETASLKENLQESTPFCLISDIGLSEGGRDGLLLVDLLKEKGYHFVSIVTTSFASIETAIMATQKGVFHYLTKPFELEVLGRLVQKALTLKLGYPKEQIYRGGLKERRKGKNSKETSPKGHKKYESLMNLPAEGMNLKKTLAEIENSFILQALKLTKGNKNQAAKLLCMNRTTLIEKMKKKGLIKSHKKRGHEAK